MTQMQIKSLVSLGLDIVLDPTLSSNTVRVQKEYGNVAAGSDLFGTLTRPLSKETGDRIINVEFDNI